MANFEVKSRRTIIDQKSGNDKLITEVFFVENCVSWAEAEDKVLDLYNAENEIVAMSKSKVVEVISIPMTEEDKQHLHIFKAILVALFTDEDGEEKETKYPILVWGKDVENVISTVTQYIKQGYGDMTLTAVTKTKILDII